MRTVEWDYSHAQLLLIDQRQLPESYEIVSYDTYHQVADAIQSMVVRGAPAIGAAAAFGLALAARHSSTRDLVELQNELAHAAEALEKARPTAVNLGWALRRVLLVARRARGSVAEVQTAVLVEAQKIADEDVALNLRMAEFGAQLIQDGDTIIHHCNTGSLATVDWGTALGVIRRAHLQGKRIRVLVDETRPRLQGARLTAWELEQYGIPYDIITDNAAGYFLKARKVNKVFVGADRMAANGDFANKIGTYMLALAAQANQVPFYPVVPTTTIDLLCPSGDQIPIEERDPQEVLALEVAGKRVAPAGATARNPAFDITPHNLITAIVTECGIISPPFAEKLAKLPKDTNNQTNMEIAEIN